MIDFINENTFKNVAKLWYLPRQGYNFNFDFLKENSIIFTTLDTIRELFQHLKFSSRSYILITHGSDYYVSRELFDQRPPCIKKWYAENTDYEHPDLIPIPIGLAPHELPEKNNHHWDVSWFVDEKNIEILCNKQKNKRVIYCTWNYINNPPKRTGILKTLEKNGIEYLWDRYGEPEGVGEYKGWQDYLETSSQYMFHISPEGNGFDSHRTWDALYMNCMPIVIKHTIFKSFSELPIIQLNNWSELTYELLDSYLDKEYNYEKLYMKYWKNHIKAEFNKL
jgi:hypothetical protein